jgi:hypothetical protein
MKIDNDPKLFLGNRILNMIKIQSKLRSRLHLSLLVLIPTNKPLLLGLPKELHQSCQQRSPLPKTFESQLLVNKTSTVSTRDKDPPY